MNKYKPSTTLDVLSRLSNDSPIVSAASLLSPKISNANTSNLLITKDEGNEGEQNVTEKKQTVETTSKESDDVAEKSPNSKEEKVELSPEETPKIDHKIEEVAQTVEQVDELLIPNLELNSGQIKDNNVPEPTDSASENSTDTIEIPNLSLAQNQQPVEQEETAQKSHDNENIDAINRLGFYINDYDHPDLDFSKHDIPVLELSQSEQAKAPVEKLEPQPKNTKEQAVDSDLNIDIPYLTLAPITDNQQNVASNSQNIPNFDVSHDFSYLDTLHEEKQIHENDLAHPNSYLRHDADLTLSNPTPSPTTQELETKDEPKPELNEPQIKQEEEQETKNITVDKEFTISPLVLQTQEQKDRVDNVVEENTSNEDRKTLRSKFPYIHPSVFKKSDKSDAPNLKNTDLVSAKHIAETKENNANDVVSSLNQNTQGAGVLTNTALTQPESATPENNYQILTVTTEEAKEKVEETASKPSIIKTLFLVFGFAFIGICVGVLSSVVLFVYNSGSQVDIRPEILVPGVASEVDIEYFAKKKQRHHNKSNLN